MFVLDQPVDTEFGHGTVAYLSQRSIGVVLDNGDRLSVLVGTPGWDRLVAANREAVAR